MTRDEHPILSFDAFDLADQLLAGATDVPVPPADFGPYRFVQNRWLGSGTIADVWLAEEQAVGRQVAIKLLRRTSQPDVWMRREIRRLGALEHQYVARLYNHGVLDDGTPWLAMEFVEGQPLDQYCRDRQSAVAERLALFRAICEGVQHAHSAGIIHGDLKPSNILVKANGEPKLLDFGLSEQFRNPDGTLTQSPSALGFTPAYAAPEQFRGEPVSIYIDVYALGVILYELLNGALPFDVSKYTTHEIAGFKNSVQRLQLPSSMARPPHERNTGGRDLDAICLKAMESDPNQRYSTVDALMQDLDRYAGSLPLAARAPHTWAYRAGKFFRRRRAAIIAASLMVLLVASLAGFFTWRLAAARNKAQREAARTRLIQRFIFDLVGAGDQQAGPSKDLNLTTMLDRGAKQANSLNSDPETQVELYQTLGTMYYHLGRYEKAEQLLHLGIEKSKSLDPASPQRLGGLIELGLMRGDQGKFAEAEELVREALAQAEKLNLPAGDPTIPGAESVLGRIYVESGAYEKAIALLDPIVKHPPTGTEGRTVLLESLTNLAVAQQYVGRTDAAESLNRQALELDRQINGQMHPRVAYDLANIATSEGTLGHYSTAESMYREAADILEKWYGPDHPETVQLRSFIGLILIQQGKNAEAEALLREVLPSQVRAYGTPTHPNISLTHDALGKLALKKGDLAGAQSEIQQSYDINRALLGEKDYRTAVTASNLADVLVKRHEYALAERTVRPAVEALTARPRPGNMTVGVAELTLGHALFGQGKLAEAEKFLNAAYEILKNQTGSHLVRLNETKTTLADLYDRLKQPEKAARFRQEVKP